MSTPLFDVESFHTALFRVLAAQANNIARIGPGVVLDDGTELVGLRPDKVRLHDTPSRLQGQPDYDEARLLVTIGPLRDGDDGGRVTHRQDRRVDYLVLAGISLNRDEQEQEEGSRGSSSLLAHACDNFMHDLKAVYVDNLLLKYDGCEGGLLDDHSMDVTWDPEIQWPKALAIIKFSGQLYELS